MEHDWLFIYGGYSGGTSQSGVYDDVWVSGDYSATWTLYDSAATGTGRYYASGLTFGRRLFITGGNSTTVALNDVHLSYW
jgi:hypothetical protein